MSPISYFEGGQIWPPNVFRKYKKNSSQYRKLNFLEFLDTLDADIIKNQGRRQRAQRLAFFQKFSNFEKKIKKLGAGRGPVAQTGFEE